MKSFETALSPDSWTEILQGGTYIAFDISSAKPVELYFTETADAPDASAKGIKVLSYPASWDYEGAGFEVDEQRIWARGDTDILGVRS